MVTLIVILLPGWDSLDRVTSLRDAFEMAGIVCLGLGVAFEFSALFVEQNRKVRRGLEIAGIFCFAMLGICEYFQYRYGHRKDFLSAVQQQNAEHDLEVARKAQTGLQTELSTSQAQLRSLQTDLAGVQQKQKPRTLTKEHRGLLVSRLSQYRGQELNILFLVGDSEIEEYARQIDAVLTEAGWKTQVRAGMHVGPGPIKHILELAVADPTNHPAAADTLLQALKDAKIPTEGVIDKAVQATEIRLIVPPKP